MQFVIKLENGTPVGNPLLLNNVKNSVIELRHSEKSFFKSEDVEPYGYGIFTHKDKPSNTDLTKEYVEIVATEQNTDLEWVQKWRLQDITYDTPELKAEDVLRSNTLTLNSKLRDLKASFERASERPSVVTGLGFSVDGAYTDLQNFQIGQRAGLLTIVDVDGTPQTVVLEDYDTIINAIDERGLSLMQIKWDTKDLLALVDLTSETAKADFDAIDVSEAIFA